MKKILISIIILFLTSVLFSIEKSDFLLGGGLRIISSDIAKYAAHPLFIKTGYIHNISNTNFNLGFEAQLGLGGTSSESGKNEFISFWKLQLNSRYDLILPNEKIIPFVNLALGFFNAGFENNQHPDALAVDSDKGVYEAETKFFAGIGFGTLFILPNEDKIQLSIDYDYANMDYIIAEGNPLGIGISANYLF
jgi:hypothetical protein